MILPSHIKGIISWFSGGTKKPDTKQPIERKPEHSEEMDVINIQKPMMSLMAGKPTEENMRMLFELNVGSEDEENLRRKIYFSWFLATMPKEYRTSIDCESLAEKIGIPANQTVDDCVKYCTTSINKYPNGAFQHCMLGKCMNRLELDEDSIRCFTKAIELAPDIAVIHLLRANAYGLIEEVDEGLKDARTAISLDPNCYFELLTIPFTTNEDTGSKYIRTAKQILSALEKRKARKK